VVAREARFIVEPSRLTPERANLICGRCHDRPIGNGTVRDEEPLSAADEFARPGIRRADWLANFTSFNGPGTADLWNDGIHSKKHHQQYSDFLKSPHYRNRSILVTCSDCHHSHGESTLPWGLEADPEDPRSALCQSCHVVDPLPHMQQQTGAQHAGERTLCINCHMPETGKTGAGRYGYLLAMPTGNPMVDPGNVYWTNDISSHVFDMPRKLSTGVRGVLPGNAMPVPYTNLCGTCHDPSQLQWLPP
jgi:cytochrome c553